MESRSLSKHEFTLTRWPSMTNEAMPRTAMTFHRTPMDTIIVQACFYAAFVVVLRVSIGTFGMLTKHSTCWSIIQGTNGFTCRLRTFVMQPDLIYSCPGSMFHLVPMIQTMEEAPVAREWNAANWESRVATKGVARSFGRVLAVELCAIYRRNHGTKIRQSDASQ